MKGKKNRFENISKRNLLFTIGSILLLGGIIGGSIGFGVKIYRISFTGDQEIPIIFNGRVGISSDGNIYDKDDIGAAAFSIAILKAGGATLVHHDYNNNIGCNNWQADEMNISVVEAATRFYGNSSMTFNDMIDLDAALDNLAYQINISTANDRFYLCVGGPMETVWRGIMRSDPTKRQYCTVISHSTWNEQHTSCDCSHTWTDVKNTGVETVDIQDQNVRLNTKIGWRWMKTDSDPDINWLYTRMDFKFGDVSDCGMAYFVVTGLEDEHGNPAKLRNLFAQLN